MNTNDLEAIGVRLKRLEREVGLWKRAAMATIVLLVALVPFSLITRTREARAADSSVKDLVVRKLTIVDEQGNRRIALATQADRAVLMLFDENGTLRASLVDLKDGPAGLSLDDEKGTTRVTLTAARDVPGLTISDERGNTRADLIAAENGPSLLLDDEKGTQRVMLVAAKGGPELDLSDEKGTSRADLITSKNGPGLLLDDEKGKPRAVFGAMQLETTRTGATEETGPSSVTLFGKNGKLIWRAP
jgi:hypothetical protein